jgi:hypothetical protein
LLFHQAQKKLFQITTKRTYTAKSIRKKKLNRVTKDLLAAAGMEELTEGAEAAYVALEKYFQKAGRNAGSSLPRGWRSIEMIMSRG